MAVFHVEHRGLAGQREGARRDRRQENLRRIGKNDVHQGRQSCRIQISGRLVDDQGNPLLAVLGHQFAFGQHQRSAEELVLSLRRPPARRLILDSQHQVGPLGTGPCIAQAPVRFPALPQDLPEILLDGPSGLVVQGDIRIEQPSGQAVKNRPQPLQVVLALCMDRLSRCGNLLLPDRQDVVGAIFTNGRVPLEQRPAKSAPFFQIAMFHVEHTPIHQAPAGLGSPVDQRPDVRVECLDWQPLGQIRSRCSWPASDMDIEHACADLDTQRNPPGPFDGMTGYQGSAGPGLNEVAGISRAVGAAATEEVDRLEQGSFPGPVGAGDDVEPPGKRQFRSRETAEMLQPQV